MLEVILRTQISLKIGYKSERNCMITALCIQMNAFLGQDLENPIKMSFSLKWKLKRSEYFSICFI